jgi:hypothetical protein
MIKFNNVEMTPKQAAVQTALTRLMEIGFSTDEREMILAMTATELNTFFMHYMSIYNRIALKVGADEVSSRDIADTAIRRALAP